MPDPARLYLFISRRLSSSANCSVCLPVTCWRARRTPPRRRPSPPSLRGGPCMAPTQTTRGWPSIWSTTTSASPLCQSRRLSGRERTHLRHTSPVLSPDYQFRHWPASGPPLASKRLPAASRQPPFPGFTRGDSRGGGNASSKRGSGGGQGTAGRSGRWASHLHQHAYSFVIVIVIIIVKKLLLKMFF